MSVENFDGDGLADQPSIIFGFEQDGDREIRELCRSGWAEPGASPGDVIARESTKSDLSDRLPELDLPGQAGLVRDDCGEDIPAVACLGDDGCGKPRYVGRTCLSPECERDWPAAVKAKVTRNAGKIEAQRRYLYASNDGRRQYDFNQVVASLPDVLVDSDKPLDRVLLILKVLLAENWGIEDFVAIYHPFRIKQEFRKDQYDHGGEPGQGEMTWADVLDEDDPYQYLKFDPHFHLFFAARRAAFDYSVAEAVEEESGWLFHRVTKGEESNVSVEDLGDLVHQMTYCFSHAGLVETGERTEFASRLKGELHERHVPEDAQDEVLARFCDAAPKLLGTTFANLNDATCDAEVSAGGDWNDGEGAEDDGDDAEDDGAHPIKELYDVTGQRVRGGGFDPRSLDASALPETAAADAGASGGAEGVASTALGEAASEAGEELAEDSPGVRDTREVCGGALRPIKEAPARLEDAEWCRQAEYVSGLRTAVEEWRRRTDGEEEVPWSGDSDVVIDPG